jgi:hypothetical protein
MEQGTVRPFKTPSRTPRTVSTAFTVAIWLSVLTTLLFNHAQSQTSQAFDLGAYQQFLNSHQNISSEQLRSLYPAGTFASKATTRFADAAYSDSIQRLYTLTDFEKTLIDDHGFMVSERLKRTTFGNAFLEVYNNDLPVFVSSDALLHAMHMSYDAMLKSIEENFLIQKLDSLLARLHTQLPVLAARYAQLPEMKKCLQDVDLYLTIPRNLLGAAVSCQYPENSAAVNTLLDFVKAEQPASYKLFSSQARDIDFSQFTVRGHYTQSPKLGQYFQSMMWLGRIEIYLITPGHVILSVADSNVQRQTIDAALLVEAARGSGAFEILEEMDSIIRYLVGESDNVTLPNMRSLMEMTKTDSASQLLNIERWKAFEDTLAGEPFAFQRILSQMLVSDPFDPSSIQPASSLLLLGQRFIVDSYVTGNVVYDKIPDKRWRALPSSFDVLFSLGNSAAAQLLEPELSQYQYSSNLAALRYLIDSYEPEFWNGTLYNSWLNSIRTLNPPLDRSSLPAFMKTAAWWQEKMNTQLASWAQLRHDNLLYAKQSYTGMTVCSYPFSYVEPLPEFYDALAQMATNAADSFRDRLPSSFAGREHMISYWSQYKGVAKTLASIARKELSNAPLTDEERVFLQQMLYTHTTGMCGENPYDGWYYKLYYTGQEGFLKNDLVVADVHTCPTDGGGNLVGWVLHVGTGPVNLAVVVAEISGGQNVAFVGPVMSYYEHVSTNFKRLTDEEWKTEYQVSPSFRPEFVNLFLAGSTGGMRPGDVPSLTTSVVGPHDNPDIPTTIVLDKNFPNPFNSSTIIPFSIPQGLSNSTVELWIHNVLGQRVKQLVNQPMPAGKYAARWDGTRDGGHAVTSGVYFYSLRVGNQLATGKMSYVK